MRLLLMVVVVGLACVACSADDAAEVRTAASETAPPTSSTTAAPPGSRTQRDAADTARLPAKESAALINQNVPDGELGTLCWARWEIARLYLQSTAVFPGSPERSAGAARDLAAALPKALESIRDARIDDSIVDEFRDHFATAVTTAATQIEPASTPAEITAVASELFNFDSYPGTVEYVSAARTTPACANP